MTTKNIGIVVIEIALIVLLSTGVRMISLDDPPGDNEIFHILAAQSWKSDGSFRVAHGIYDRNSDFTILLSALTDDLGNNVAIARMPSVLAGALLVGALFLWTRSIAGRTAGWLAGLLMCFSPLAIGISQFVRIYSTLGLVFFLGSISIYSALTERRPTVSTGLLALAGIGLLAISVRFHILTIIGTAGLIAWVIVEKRRQLLSLIVEPGPWRWAIVLMACVAAGLIAFFSISDEAARYVGIFRDIQPQSAAKADLFWYYHDRLIENYPLLWGAMPLAAIFTIARKPSFGLFCSIIFFTVLIAHSLAARKALRYFYYALPFFFAIWGYFLAEAIPYLRRITAEMIRTLTPEAPLSESAHAIIQGIIVTLIVVFFALSNSILIPLYDLITADSERGPDWAGAEALLAPWLDDKDAVILASPMQAPLFYYGRTDIEFGPKYIYESSTQQEFGIDPRTGLRAVSTAESMQLVFDCYRRGLLIMDSTRWRGSGYGPDDSALSILQQHAHDLELPQDLGLTAYVWDRPVAIERKNCSLLEPVDQ